MDNRDHPVTISPEDTELKGRRAVLKSAVTAMPMILTLQSGAALARSSNLMSASSPADALDTDGRLLCLDERFYEPVGDGKVDLQEPPYCNVSAITDRQYYSEPNNSSETNRTTMCLQGGTYYYKDGGYQPTQPVYKGMMVSATALSSFAGYCDITEI